MAPERPHRVVIVGGGFGGLNAARELPGPRFDVTLVDRRNFHLFQPLLYQVATGGLSPGDIASPLRELLRRRRNVFVLLAEVRDFDVEGRRVLLPDGELPYDSLIVAAGARPHYFGKDAWEAVAPGLKTIEDATEIRRRVLGSFEAAEKDSDPSRRRDLLTFVIIGGGPTGVELAGALAELARDTLRHDFRSIDPAGARIILVEHAERVLPAMPPGLSLKAERFLGRLGVEVLARRRVKEIQDGEMVLAAPEGEERLRAGTVLWAAGVRPSPLAAILAGRTGAALDRGGRIVVAQDLSIPGHPEIFVIGDMASCAVPGGAPLPGVAPVAMQQGRHVARVLRARLDGEEPEPFRYFDRGDLATIGRAAAVGKIGRLQISGFPAWVIWLFVHLLYLVGFENRILVLLQWAWSYFTWNRSARLITERERPVRPGGEPAPAPQPPGGTASRG